MRSINSLLKTAALALAVVFSFTYCYKKEKSFTTYFYMNEPAGKEQLKLFIDGEYKGELPYLPVNSCNTDNIKQNALLVPVPVQKYKVEARDTKGQVISSGMVKVTRHSASATECSGYFGISKTHNLIIIDLASGSEIQK